MSFSRAEDNSEDKPDTIQSTLWTILLKQDLSLSGSSQEPVMHPKLLN